MVLFFNIFHWFPTSKGGVNEARWCEAKLSTRNHKIRKLKFFMLDSELRKNRTFSYKLNNWDKEAHIYTQKREIKTKENITTPLASLKETLEMWKNQKRSVFSRTTRV